MVSFLMSEGHPQARFYPIWMLWEEVDIASRRVNRTIRTHATSVMMAMAAGQGGKKSVKAFKEYLEKLGGED